MGTDTTQVQEVTVNANDSRINEATQTEAKSFTQEDVNHIVAKRVAKYADYETLKEKAAKYDEIAEASKTELQKATERATALEAELNALKSAEQLRQMREEVASQKGIPSNLLTASSREACEAQADELLEWAKPKTPTGYPKVKDAGDPVGNYKRATRDQFAEWLNSM